MTISLILIGIAFYFLARVTNWFTIRLQRYEKPLIAHSDSVLTKVVDDTDDEQETAIVEHHKPPEPLLLEATCSLTKLHNEFKDSRYKPSTYKEYRDSYQIMKFGQQTITINAKSLELHSRLDEINKVVNSKFKPLSIKMGQLKFPELTTKVYRNNRHDFDIVLRNDLLVPKEWLEAHANDVIPEPTMDLIIDDNSLHVNGNYKHGLIDNFMGDFTHKERAGKKGLVPVMNGEHLERLGDNFFACKDGEHLN